MCEDLGSDNSGVEQEIEYTAVGEEERINDKRSDERGNKCNKKEKNETYVIDNGNIEEISPINVGSNSLKHSIISNDPTQKYITSTPIVTPIKNARHKIIYDEVPNSAIEENSEKAIEEADDGIYIDDDLAQPAGANITLISHDYDELLYSDQYNYDDVHLYDNASPAQHPTDTDNITSAEEDEIRAPKGSLPSPLTKSVSIIHTEDADDEEDFQTTSRNRKRKAAKKWVAKVGRKNKRHEMISFDVENVRYHQGNPNIPYAYLGLERKLTNDEIVQIAMMPIKSLTCKEIPQRATTNCLFFIRADKPLSDAKGDGHWPYDLSSTDCYRMKESIQTERERRFNPRPNDIVYRYDGRAKTKDSPGDGELIVIQRKYRLEAEPRFKRYITHVRGPTAEYHGNIYAVQYLFDDGVVVPLPDPRPHGNSKGLNPPAYGPARPSRIDAVHKLARTMSVPEAITREADSQGGLAAISSPSDIVKANKIYHDRSKKGAAKQKEGGRLDEWGMVAQWSQTTEGKEVCQKMEIGPVPYVLVATKQSIADLCRFTTDKTTFSIMHVDPTFNIGEFNVTVLTAQNLLLRNKKDPGRKAGIDDPSYDDLNVSPMAVGVVFITRGKAEEDYDACFKGLVDLCPQLKNCQFWGSDAEDALIKTGDRRLVYSRGRLQCARHTKGDIKRNMCRFGLRDHVADVVSQIFGTSYLNIRNGYAVSNNSLLATKSEDEFNAKWDELEAIWATYSTKGKNEGQRLIDYMRGQWKEMMFECMTAGIRTKAGLGCPPKHFINNLAESANAKIKGFMKNKESNMHHFLQKMLQFFKTQEREFGLAYINKSEKHVLKERYTESIFHKDFDKMTESQKREVLDNANRITFQELEVMASPLDSADWSVFNVLPTDAQKEFKIDVPLQVLEGIWSKACTYLAKDDSIKEGFKHSTHEEFLVRSSSSPTTHTVKIIGGTDAMTCECENYRIHSICSHVLAVAHKMLRVRRFLHWHKRSGQGSSLSAAITNGKERKKVGRKPNSPRQKKKHPQVLTPFHTKRNPPTWDPAWCEELKQDTGVHRRTVFVRFLKDTRIQVCAGCKHLGKSARGIDKKSKAPYDICLAAFDHVSIPDPKDKTKTRIIISQSHYHLNKECVQGILDRKAESARNPVHICNNIKDELEQCHINKLKEVLGEKCPI